MNEWMNECMHACPCDSRNCRMETSPFALLTGGSKHSQNDLWKCLAVDPGVWRNSQQVLLIGNEKKMDCEY